MSTNNRMAKAVAAMALTTTALSAQAGPFEDRERDWRNGAVVYQVLVDRFAPAADLNAKRALYPAPKVLRRWDEEPRAGSYVEAAKVWSHEIDFWGGDLQSLRSKLAHVQGLGADVLYLNPIHLGYTNHKYDSLDFQAVSPEYGSRADVKALAADVHARGMKLVLDGVFNHMGRNSPAFLEAQKVAGAKPAPTGGAREAGGGSKFSDWFVFGPQFPGGARTWKGVLNLPELNLENPAVREHIWAGRDSVVRSYLRDGVDGWRLDTAYELGTEFLSQLTAAAHREKPGSLVIGEIVNHPAGWMPALDGVMNFHVRSLLLALLKGDINSVQAGTMLDRMVADVGIEPLLKSWLLLDNHDVQRVATQIPDAAQRRLAQVLQFTLPGAPNIYYGAEVGMTGGEDPAQRGPMRWDLVAESHPEMVWTRQLIQLHRQHRALRVGDYRTLAADKLLAFERYTDRVADSVIVLANATSAPLTETVQMRNGMLMDAAPLRDLLATTEKPVTVGSGLVRVTVPARSVRVLAPDLSLQDGYSVYKRIR